MADFFNNPMPTSGAHFVENPAKVTVERIARAIEYDADLAAKYNSGNFFNDIGNVRRAFELSRSFRDGTGAAVRKAKAQAQKSVKEGGMGLKRGSAEFEAVVKGAHGGTLPVKQTNVGEGGRKAIAAAIGRARGFVKTNIRNRGRYLGVYGTVSGLKQGAIKTRKWGSNKGLPGWKFGKSIPKDSVFGRNREGGSLMKFKAGASSESAFKKATLSAIRTTYAAQIKAAGGAWWNVPAAKAAFDSAVKGRRHSEPLTAAQSNERMYARFGGKSSYSEQTAGMAAARSGKGSTRVSSAMASRPSSAYPHAFGARRSSAVGEAAAAGAAAGFEAGVEAGTALAAPTRAEKAAATRARNKAAKESAAAAAALSNPFSSLGYDEMGDLALSNPTGIGFLDSIESSIGNVPVIGPVIAPIIAPAALGAVAAVVHILVVPRLEGYLPAWAQPYSYSIGGAAVGIVSGVVAAKSSDGTVRTAAGLIGGAAVAIGVGIDAYRMFIAKSGATAGDDDMGGLALSGDDDMGDLALSGDDMGDLALSGLALSGLSGMGAVALGGDRAAFGDGGAYQVQSLGFAGDHSALHAMYADAAMADAYFSGPDLDGVEGEAALAGPSSFMGTFGAAPVRAAGQKRMQSRHAGLRGHRWGWLIKMVGYENFQKITALDPEQRVNVIKQLREQAMASVQRYVDESKAAQLASKPVTAPAELSGYGYGATMFSGGSY